MQIPVWPFPSSDTHRVPQAELASFTHVRFKPGCQNPKNPTILGKISKPSLTGQNLVKHEQISIIYFDGWCNLR